METERVPGPLALAPVLQVGEGHAGILARAGEGKARHCKDEIDIVLFAVQVVFGHILRNVQRCGLGGAGGQGDQVEDEALVLVGQKTGGQANEQHDQQRADSRIGDQGAPAAPQEGRSGVVVPIPEGVEIAVERGEETAALDGAFALHGLQQRGAQRRRQHQRHHDGQRHGRDDGDGKLAIDDAGRAAEECHGQEHGGQHQADADQRAGDFLHAFEGGLARRQPLFMHDALDILHHHDGVVHQQADHQHQREQSQGVDRITRRRQHAEGAQQHHRHRDGRDQRRAPVLQEDVHHQHHQDDGLDQGHDHVVDRKADEGGVVDRVDQLHARRQRRPQFLRPGLDRIHGLERIGPRRQHDGEDRRRDSR